MGPPSIQSGLQAFGLTLQLAVTILLTTLFFVLTSSVRRAFVESWAVAWAMAAIALGLLLVVELRVASDLTQVFLPMVGLLGMTAGYFLCVGCRQYSELKSTRYRDLLYLAIASVGVVVGPFLLHLLLLARFGVDLPDHALALTINGAGFSVFAFLGFAALPRPFARGATAETRLLSIALVSNGLFLGHFLPLVLAAAILGQPKWLSWFEYGPLIVVLLEVMLAFGMVVVAMDLVRRELERTNAELAAATQRLHQLAQRDPMTMALNRHAFYTLVEANRTDQKAPIGGAVAMLDIDNLKPINDQLGHAAGDAVIRTVSKAVRSLIRADDLLFRWGGDEFLVVLPNVTPQDARLRMDRLNDMLRHQTFSGMKDPIAIRVSAGVAGFTGLDGLEAAIEMADRQMYTDKERNRAADQA